MTQRGRAARPTPTAKPGERAASVDVELVLRSSAATLVLTVGVTLAFVGAVVVGPGLLWPGAGFVALGAAGIVRERRAARALLGDAQRERGE